MRKFNLSLDDMSPYKKAGLNFESIVWCDKLIAEFPRLKIDLFVPTRYARLNESPSLITKNKEWVHRLKSLSENNYRICLHGLYHRRGKGDFSWHTGIESNNNEWENLTYNQASMLLNKIEEDFRKCNIKYRKVFRPPGWHIGGDVVRLLSDSGYLIAGDERYYNKFKNKFGNLKWTSYNWDLTGPCKVTDSICAYGHISNWTNNYMNKERYHLINKLLSSEDFDFKFIEDV